MLVILTAGKSDRQGINQITNEFSDHEYSHTPSYFDEAISTNKILIALVAKKVVGYLTYHIIWGNTPYIELLRVTVEYQRTGVGSLLVRELESHLRNKKYKVLISSSEKVNKVGNIFHEKLGFQKIGEVDMVYGVEVFYKKELK